MRENRRHFRAVGARLLFGAIEGNMRITIPLVCPGRNADSLRVAVVPRLVPAFGFGLAVAGAGSSVAGRTCADCDGGRVSSTRFVVV